MSRLCWKGLMMSARSPGCAMRVQPGRVCKTQSQSQFLSLGSSHTGVITTTLELLGESNACKAFGFKVDFKVTIKSRLTGH